MDKNIEKKPVSSSKPSSNQNKRFMFDKDNYKWMLIGVLVIALGFILMSGTTDINDTRKLIVSPLVIISGFLIEIYAIMKSPREE